jgi:hypothetical protein
MRYCSTCHRACFEADQACPRDGGALMALTTNLAFPVVVDREQAIRHEEVLLSAVRTAGLVALVELAEHQALYLVPPALSSEYEDREWRLYLGGPDSYARDTPAYRMYPSLGGALSGWADRSRGSDMALIGSLEAAREGNAVWVGLLTADAWRELSEAQLGRGPASPDSMSSAR